MNEQQNIRIDFDRICTRYGLSVARPGDRHYRGGEWICLPCPFCSGQVGNHLGFNKVSGVFSCFRCGRHGKIVTLSKLLNLGTKEAIEVAKEFALDSFAIMKERKKADNSYLQNIRVTEDEFELPGKEFIPKLHKRYLKGRGFDAEELQNQWGLRFCDKIGRYAYRIIIPVTYKGKTVTFTTRDVTGQAQDRYLACDVNKAIRHHKHCVYGLDKSPYKTVIIVEGTFGVWRIGVGAGCTLGTGWTPAQAEIIASAMRKSYIFFDPEEKEATQRAKRLAKTLSSYAGHKSYVIEGIGANGRDTGELTEDEVQELRRLLVK